MTIRDTRIFRALLATIAAAFFLLALWTPLMQDDLVFMAQSAVLPEADAPAASAHFSWEAWRGHVALMYLDNNGRLSNILAPLGAWLLPQWVRALLTGCCAAWIFYMVTLMACDKRRWQALLLIWALSLVAWPWRDRMMMWDYALNYLFTSALILPFIYLYCRQSLSRALVAAGALCGFFGAWFHDGSALCLVATVGTLAMIRRFRLTSGQWTMLAALLAGTIAVLASPGEWQRASGELGSNSLISNILITVKIEPLAWVLVAVWVVCLKKAGGWLKDDLLVAASLMAFYSLIMSIMLDPSGRYGWQAELFATVALFRRWRGVKVGGTLRKLLLAGAGVFVTAILASAISYQYRLNAENEEIYSEAEASPTGTVCRDLLSPADEPRTALRLPTTDVLGSAFQMACANACRSERGKMLAVVPECFTDFSIDSIRQLDGNARVGIYRGYLIGTDTVTPFDPPGFLSGAQRTAVRDLVLTDADGNSEVRRFWIYKFREPRAGGRAAVMWGEVNDDVTRAELVK